MPNGSTPAETPPVDWVKFRQEMPVAENWAYFDHAAVSPLPKGSRDALIAWASEAAANGDICWPDWARRVEAVRTTAARLLGATPEEIALVRSTTQGINFVAEGFPWQRGDNVVTLADEFPANQYPWMNLADRGVETRRVPTEQGRADLDRLEDACDERTRVVAVSWVSFSSGWRNDVGQLAQIAHRHGAKLFLDAIQGLGVFPLDVSQTPVDFLSADGHKWMLGPEGAGIFYTRREHLDLLRPIGVGWNSVVHAEDFQHIELILRDTASRYEGGTQNMAGMIAFGASLELLERATAAALSKRICDVGDLACERLAEIGAVIHSDRRPEHKSGIIFFELPGQDPVTVRKRSLEHHVVLSCRAGRLRISPHAYNNEEDIDRLIEVLSI